MLGVAFFLTVVGAVYYFTSFEDTGTTCLIFGAMAYLLLCGYIGLQYRRRDRIPRAQDRSDGDYKDAAGEVAFFPSNSVWPVGLGLGFVSLAIGLVYGPWFFAIGGILMLGAVIGYNVESEAKY